jgi:IS30 family transposase
MGAPRILTTEQVDWAIERYRQGESTHQIGDDYGVSPTTIRRALERRGVARRSKAKGRVIHRRISPEDRRLNAFIVAFYIRGWSTIKLGQMLEKSPTTIARRLTQMGVKPRDRSMCQMPRWGKLEPPKERY